MQHLFTFKNTTVTTNKLQIFACCDYQGWKKAGFFTKKPDRRLFSGLNRLFWLFSGFFQAFLKFKNMHPDHFHKFNI